MKRQIKRFNRNGERKRERESKNPNNRMIRCMLFVEAERSGNTKRNENVDDNRSSPLQHMHQYQKQQQHHQNH